ncbi:hypothetical protein VSA01S_21010 [Vibrio sagamiensis NBRC 104589]|uniref:Uncharacterized protein n=1 Tax=Vibrio sagamiensis NBRC 104589 TaxID=1219064 RepID=A0A511QFA9_9VIBR|nr:hypothetical protein VSA01S_21010 [Vibrio sagamiensis NBRC 104589]
MITPITDVTIREIATQKVVMRFALAKRLRSVISLILLSLKTSSFGRFFYTSNVITKNLKYR